MLIYYSWLVFPSLCFARPLGRDEPGKSPRSRFSRGHGPKWGSLHKHDSSAEDFFSNNPLSKPDEFFASPNLKKPSFVHHHEDKSDKSKPAHDEPSDDESTSDDLPWFVPHDDEFYGLFDNAHPASFDPQTPPAHKPKKKVKPT